MSWFTDAVRAAQARASKEAQEILTKTTMKVVTYAAHENALLHAEARGECREREHTLLYLRSKGHHELADEISNNKHWPFVAVLGSPKRPPR